MEYKFLSSTASNNSRRREESFSGLINPRYTYDFFFFKPTVHISQTFFFKSKKKQHKYLNIRLILMENRKNLSLSFSNDDDSNNNQNFKCPFTNQILIRYIGTLIFFIGIISTLLSICVFTRKPLRECYLTVSREREELFFCSFRTEIVLFLLSNLSHK